MMAKALKAAGKQAERGKELLKDVINAQSSS